MATTRGAFVWRRRHTTLMIGRSGGGRSAASRRAAMRCRKTKVGKGVCGIECRARQNIQVSVAVPGSEDDAARHGSPQVVVDRRPVVFCDGRIEGRGH